MLSFMIFMFLGFLCLVFVLLYLLYMQEKIARNLRDEHAEMRLLLRVLEEKLKNLEKQHGKKDDSVRESAENLLTLEFPTLTNVNEKNIDPDLDLHLDAK